MNDVTLFLYLDLADGAVVKNMLPVPVQEAQVQSLGPEDPLE